MLTKLDSKISAIVPSTIDYSTEMIQFDTVDANNFIEASSSNDTIMKVTLTDKSDTHLSISALFYALK